MKYSDINILMLTVKEIPDYLQDSIYYGLVKLGCNVVDYPRRKSLHGSWANPEYSVNQLLFNFPETALKKDPDIMIVAGMYGNYRPYNSFDAWHKFIMKTLMEYNPAKLIMLDAEDSRECHYPMLDRPYDAVFKRELFYQPYGNWFNINFSAIPEPFTFVPYTLREYDVSFVATISNDYRIEVRNFLKQRCNDLGLSAFIHVEKEPLDRSEYLRILSQSKTSVSVRGAGVDCYRYWEIPSRGVVMISDDHGLPIKNDFAPNHIFKFKNLEDLDAILRAVKERPDILEDMALESLRHSHKFHTPEKRAMKILKEIFPNVS